MPVRVGPEPGARSYIPPLAGLATIAVIAVIIASAVGMFRGSFTHSAPVTVLAARAGLVMNPDAKVKMRGAEVGKVASIESLPDGQAALHLAMDPSKLRLIPANVLVDIASSTVFGAKFVELVPPADPSPRTLQVGQTLDGQHVTVEVNTVFEQLTSVLAKIEPEKLNETLGAVAKALNGRGEKVGRTLSDLNSLLAKLDPSRPTLSHDLAIAPEVIDAYADAAPGLVKTAAASAKISQSIVDEQKNLDTLLISAIGLADIGNQVVGDNRKAFTDVVHLILPTTDLFSQYHEAIACGGGGVVVLATQAVPKNPGIPLMIGQELGGERYRYPLDLPRVAAKGGPQCTDLPRLPFEGHPPFVVGDVGTSPFRYGNQGAMWNSDLLKQWLFGPLDGPPRNTVQIGQPG